MVAMSKFKSEPLCHMLCGTLWHPGQSCSQFLLQYSRDYCIHMSKYYLPILIIPLLRQRLCLKVLWDALQVYGSTVTCAGGTMTLFFGMMCVFRQISGKVCLPMYPLIFTAMQMVWFYPHRVFRIFAIYTLQVTLDVALRKNAANFLPAHLILHSKLVKTALFMLSSAVMLHFKKTGAYRGFWFINPLASTTEGKDHWFKRVATQLKSSLCYGLAFDLLRALLRNYKTMRKGNQTVLGWLGTTLKSLRFNMVGFFVIYEGIYQSTQWLWRSHCSSSSSSRENSAGDNAIIHCIAAFLGGISYMCVDNMMLLLFAMLLAVQLLWERFGVHVRKMKTHWLLHKLVDLPMARLLLPFQVAYCVESYFNSAESIGAVGRLFLETITYNKIKDLLVLVKSNDVHELLLLNLKHNHKFFS